MKGICGDAKQQLNQCMLLGDCENATGNGNGNGNGNGSGNSASPVHRGGRAFCARQVHSLAIRNTSSYDTMERPFRPDNLRGRWSKSADFYFASSSYAFSTMAFSDASVWALMFGGWKYYLSGYLLAVCFYSLPIFLIQTFLGQFSTSGAISAFRVSPIFKGIGYSILLLNLGTLTYYSINAAVPFIYAVNSVREVMPWMSCNNTWNTPECSTHDHYNEEEHVQKPHATVEFFQSVIGSIGPDSSDWSLSWPMLLAIAGIWCVVLALLLSHVSLIGKALRCACVLMFGFFVAVFVYLVIHEQVNWQGLQDYLHPTIPSWLGIQSALGTAILQASMVLGPGWGSIITLGSYNSFRSDAERLSIWVCLTHVLITVMATVCGHVANDHFELHVAMWHVEKQHTMQFLYLAYAYLFASFATLPRLWSFLFFAVIFLAELSALIIQMMSVLTALFDEFEQLRPKKKPITILLALSLMATSIYFCTQRGFRQVSALSYMSLFTQIIISALLVMMATWIYGRVRFQCDLQFMLGKTISSFKIFCIRFVVPFFIALSLWETIHMLTANGAGDSLIWISQTLIYLVALGYMLYRLSQTNGTWRQRTRQCFAPHDWHPVNADNRRFYEEIMGTSEMLVIDNGNTA
ncbi:sodium- and chloride-dependent glycine transporter 1 [Drosophila virilis]|uniref:sodium- and chloride-dependent glycine transporter 1 n=1 Tax=Drosophila virilis TaxID=7244 RepID=UPI00139613E8|nr:sodium- and chloride-dependent glycine transporter 1 [Drosophila virilis]XP_032294208.1 sodium- and chloride-dependent glycine transporter 1 [Drosophila virilis]XP_032294209.1 sodium- and chloride-dependent glycine transporter 1 [Drosophila virilis]XP_032294210.1 sodium- and chloride-dependent glycine transporter 1 [Drosophila virilis]